MGITKQITTQYKALKLISSYFQRETFKINISGMAMKRNPHEIEEMRERKKQKNRESAQRARDRFKAKMRWLEDQVRHIQERHDNLVRENTYMRHMHSVQSSKLDQLIKRETEYIQAENSISNKRSHSSSDESSDNDSGCTSPKQSKFSIGFLSQSSTKTQNQSTPNPQKNQQSQHIQDFLIQQQFMDFYHISCQNYHLSNHCYPIQHRCYPINISLYQH